MEWKFDWGRGEDRAQRVVEIVCRRFPRPRPHAWGRCYRTAPSCPSVLASVSHASRDGFSVCVERCEFGFKFLTLCGKLCNREFKTLRGFFARCHFLFKNLFRVCVTVVIANALTEVTGEFLFGVNPLADVFFVTLHFSFLSALAFG